MPELLRFLLRNMIIGVAAGWSTLALLLFTNTGGLGHVVLNTSDPIVPLFLLAAGFAITFGSIAMGAAIMTQPYDRGNGPRNGLREFSLRGSLKAMVAKTGWSGLGRGRRILLPVPVKDGERRR